MLQLTLAAAAGVLAVADPLGHGVGDAEAAVVGLAEPDAAVAGAVEPDAAVVGLADPEAAVVGAVVAVVDPAVVGAAEPDAADAVGEAQLVRAAFLACVVKP